MTTALVLARLPSGDDPDPDPALVLAQRPTVAQLMEAANILGAFPDDSYLAGNLRVSLLA